MREVNVTSLFSFKTIINVNEVFSLVIEIVFIRSMFYFFLTQLFLSSKVNIFAMFVITQMKRLLLFISTIFILSPAALAIQDTIVFKSGEVIIGEIKSMDKGVVTVETSYSDSDFKIEWNKVQEVYTLHKFLISLKGGERYNGSIRATHPDSARLYTYDYGTVVVKLNDIVYLDEIDDKFRDRLYYSIDMGISLTRANNLKQFTSRSSIAYTARKWSLGGSINSLVSDQDGQDVKTERTDGNLVIRYILNRGWFFFPELTFLSNTEQQLELRTATKLGAGKYLFRTNRAYWNLTGGIAFNNEKFSNEEPDRNSREAFFGTNLNLYDIGDFNFLFNGIFYPSFTESGRKRIDLTLDIKYDLPFDFYIKLGGTLNYDNQPIEEGTESDYVIQSTIGWEWD